MTYDDLKKQIASFMGRKDLVNEIPGFIDLCEAALNNNPDFRVRGMVCKLDVELTGNELGLPEDYLGMRMLRHESGKEIPEVSPQRLATVRACHDSNAYVDLGDRLEFAGAGDKTPLEMFCYRRIPPLTDTDQTNWLLKQNSAIYLYGSLLEATEYVKDDARIQIWMQRYAGAVDGLVAADKRSRWSGPLKVSIE